MAGTPPAAGEPTVVALLAAYNEEDVVGQVVADLVGQGIGVWFVDDGSTDGTVARVEPWVGRGVLQIERRPPRDEGSWAALLRRKEELAAELAADWFLHHDADELRESPWEGLTLRQAIGRADRLGFNAVDFAVLDFLPTHDGWREGDDLRAAFTHWRPGAAYDKLQVKAWKRTGEPVELVSSGGHEARFAGRRVCPLRFPLRHYPIRGQAHGERKVLRDRQPRLAGEARERGWHAQYAGVDAATRFVRDPAELRAYDPEAVRFELALRHRGVEELERALAAAGAEVTPVARLAEAEGLLAAERERAERTSRALDERNRELAERTAERHALSRELDLRNRELAAERAALADARGRVAELEEAVALERARTAELLASRSWRWTAPVRALLRAVGAG